MPKACNIANTESQVSEKAVVSRNKSLIFCFARKQTVFQWINNLSLGKLV